MDSSSSSSSLPSSSSSSSSSSSLLDLALTEAAGGAAAGAIADAVFYSLDSAKVRAQSPPSPAAVVAGRGENFRILFRGLGPTICLGSVPVFGSFFLLYTPLKQIVLLHKQTGGSDDDDDNTKRRIQQEENIWMLPFVSALCAIPATIIGVPADVLKKRLVLGLDKDVVSAIRHAVARNGLFAGWRVNLIKDIPFAGVKIGLYEIFVQYYQRFYNQQQQQDDKINTNTKTTNTNNNKISSLGASICGIASGVSCAILTCPLDVVNTRIKADSTTISSHSASIRTVALEILQKEGVRALFRGVVMRSVVLGIGSSIFWPIQHRVAHSLQSFEVDNRTTTPSFMG